MINQIKNQAYRLLRSTQKYTDTDNVYLAKGGFWLTLGQVVTTAISFLLAMAFANLLNPAIYGNYKYIISLVGFLGIFSLTGIETAVTQAAAQGLEGSFYSGLKTKLKWGLLGSLTATGGAIYYWIRGNDFLPIPLLISAIFLPLMLAAGVYNSFLIGRKLFNVATKYDIITRIIFAGAMATTLLLTQNLFWLIAVYFVSYAFLNYFFYILTKSRFQPNKKEDPQTLSYGKHLSLMDVISNISSYVDKIMLFTLIGSIQLAVYSFAIIIPDKIGSILRSINVLALPKLAAKSQEEIKTSLMKKFGKLFLLTGTIVVGYMITAPYIYKIFFPQYLDSIPYSQIAALSLLVLPFSLISTAFSAKMKKKQLYLLKITPLLKLALLIILIPPYGIWGAILGIVGTRIFAIALMLFLFKRF